MDVSFFYCSKVNCFLQFRSRSYILGPGRLQVLCTPVTWLTPPPKNAQRNVVGKPMTVATFACQSGRAPSATPVHGFRRCSAGSSSWPAQAPTARRLDTASMGHCSCRLWLAAPLTANAGGMRTPARRASHACCCRWPRAAQAMAS